MVTEYFKPTSQISRLELRCGNNWVEQVRRLVYEIGTSSEAADHYFDVKDLSSDDESIMKF